MLTALANDVGYELVFSRQLISMADADRHRARPVDEWQLDQPPSSVRRGATTRDCSPSVWPGYDGGSMAEAGTVDHCLVVRSDSVHRIQEVQSAVVFDLWARVQRVMSGASA